MEYKRIDENTIRCIITEEDMQDYGLDLDEFLTHSPKSEDFLRHIIEEARQELGYQAKHGMVSMRLEVLSDGRISLTFVNGDEKKVAEQVMRHLQQIFPDVDKDILEEMLDRLGNMTEKQRSEKISELITNSLARTMENLGKQTKEKCNNTNAADTKQKENVKEIKESYRLYEFSTMHHVIDFCKAVPLKQPIRSHLYKMQDSYFLVVERYRISDYHFNLLTAIAFEFSKVHAEPDSTYRHMIEYGQMLIENRAIGTLKKL